jgi:hypothetical protein
MGFSRVLFMPAPKNNLKLKNIFPSFLMKFRKGIDSLFNFLVSKIDFEKIILEA